MFQYCKQMPNLNLLGMIEKVLNFASLADADVWKRIYICQSFIGY